MEDKTQKEKIREKFENAFPDPMEKKYGKGFALYCNMCSGEYRPKIADFWLNELDLATKETEERLVRDIEEYEKTADEHVEPNEVYICCQDILALIRNK